MGRRTQLPPIPEAPKDTQFCIEYVYYKIGHQGLVFRWGGGSWVRSTKESAELLGNEYYNRR